MTTSAVVFVHLPKTAGLALRDTLARRFPADVVWTQEPQRVSAVAKIEAGIAPSGPGGASDLNRRFAASLLTRPQAERDRLRLIQGHVLFGIDRFLAQPTAHVTLLRDPVDRVLSLYRHRVEHQGMRMDLDRFVRTCADWGVDNAQTRRLSGWDGGDIRTADIGPMLALTMDNLAQRFRVVGITERYAESLVLLRRAFGWDAIELARKNETSSGPRRADVDPEVIRLIEAHNQADAEVYRWARSRFDDALAAAGDVEAEVAQLRARSARAARRARVRSRVGTLARRAGLRR